MQIKNISLHSWRHIPAIPKKADLPPFFLKEPPEMGHLKIFFESIKMDTSPGPHDRSNHIQEEVLPVRSRHHDTVKPFPEEIIHISGIAQNNIRFNIVQFKIFPKKSTGFPVVIKSRDVDLLFYPYRDKKRPH